MFYWLNHDSTKGLARILVAGNKKTKIVLLSKIMNPGGGEAGVKGFGKPTSPGGNRPHVANGRVRVDAGRKMRHFRFLTAPPALG
jgi:hypothetical protein